MGEEGYGMWKRETSWRSDPTTKENTTVMQKMFPLGLLVSLPAPSAVSTSSTLNLLSPPLERVGVEVSHTHPSVTVLCYSPPPHQVDASSAAAKMDHKTWCSLP